LWTVCWKVCWEAKACSEKKFDFVQTVNERMKKLSLLQCNIYMATIVQNLLHSFCTSGFFYLYIFKPPRNVWEFIITIKIYEPCKSGFERTSFLTEQKQNLPGDAMFWYAQTNWWLWNMWNYSYRFQLSIIKPKPNQLLTIRLLSQSQTAVKPKPIPK